MLLNPSLKSGFSMGSKGSRNMQSASWLGRNTNRRSGEPQDSTSLGLKSEAWFVGEMSRSEADERLVSFPAGSFLVRKGNSGFAIRYAHLP